MSAVAMLRISSGQDPVYHIEWIRACQYRTGTTYPIWGWEFGCPEEITCTPEIRPWAACVAVSTGCVRRSSLYRAMDPVRSFLRLRTVTHHNDLFQLAFGGFEADVADRRPLLLPG